MEPLTITDEDADTLSLRPGNEGIILVNIWERDERHTSGFLLTPADARRLHDWLKEFLAKEGT